MSPRYMKPFLMILLSVFCFLSCSDEDACDLQVNTNKTTTMTMVLSATPPTFDTISTRGNTTEWPDGARLYFKFTTEGQPVSGCSTYSAATDKWTLNISGTIQESEDLKLCEVWYFEGADDYNDSGVQLSATTAIYHDSSAKYFCTNGCVSVTAHLQSIQARLRFSGTEGTALKIINWPISNYYNSKTWEIGVSDNDTLSLTIGDDGFTPYFYGTLGKDKRWIEVDKDDVQYIRSFTESTIEKGKSYSITSPTEELVLPDKWFVKRSFTLTYYNKTVTFNMIRVQGGTFQMGSTTGNSDEAPVHSVTITKDYYLGETEVSQALWFIITGYTPNQLGSKWDTSYGLGDNYPAYYISYNDCQSFLTNLNKKKMLLSQLNSGEQFRLPTEAEWEFAAKGGNKSNGYTYSGSNKIGDVAWYKVNSFDIGTSNENYGTHVVKTKSPNEIGLYDMSGNVWEWCYDWYGSYSTSAQTDPTGPASGSFRVNRGGGWDNSATGCRVAIRSGHTPTNRYFNVGFRLCLGAPIPELSVSTTSLGFGAQASSQQIAINTNGDYTYSTSASWLTITQSSNKSKLTVYVSANYETSDRNATITLTLGSLSKTIQVIQAAKSTSNERTFLLIDNDKIVTFKMKKVEGGTFQMGHNGKEDVTTPVHSVTITKDYYMGETEVTQALWYAVMGKSPTSNSSDWNSTYGLTDESPAYYICYGDCQVFLTELNSKLSSQLGSGELFRFPTEAEWEFAAKGGNKSNGYTYSGSNTLGDIGWYTNNSSSTNTVKSKTPNELGLYDMSGNVYEWCYDWYGSYNNTTQTDPTGPSSGSYRVNRGGGWNSGASFCRVAERSSDALYTRYNNLGFRLCLGAPIEE